MKGVFFINKIFLFLIIGLIILLFLVWPRKHCSDIWWPYSPQAAFNAQPYTLRSLDKDKDNIACE